MRITEGGAEGREEALGFILGDGRYNQRNRGRAGGDQIQIYTQQTNLANYFADRSLSHGNQEAFS